VASSSRRSAASAGSDQDRFALGSYEKAIRAQREGAFDDEIVPVEVPGRKGAVTLVNKDETPRETTLEALAKLQPAFKPGGTITAGNASKLNDGGAAVIVASEERARELGAKPIARIVAQGQFAHEPERFLSAPKGAIERCLAKAGWSIDDVDLFEVNEAFSGVECGAPRPGHSRCEVQRERRRGGPRSSHRRVRRPRGHDPPVRAPSAPGPIRPRDTLPRGRRIGGDGLRARRLSAWPERVA